MDTPAQKRITEYMPLAKSLAAEFVGDDRHRKRQRDDLFAAGFLALTTAISVKPDAPAAYLRVAIERALNEEWSRLAPLSVPRSTSRDCRDTGRDVPQAPREVSEDHLRDVADSYDPQGLAELLEELEACCEDDLDRGIVRMRHESYSMSEIAEALKTSKGTISKRLAKIEDRFRIRETN